VAPIAKVAGRARPRPDAPLHPLLDEWAGELSTLNRSRLTIRAYLNDLGQFFEWLGPKRDPLAVEPADVRKFAHAMTNAGLEVRSRARRTTAVREFYKYLVKTKRRPESPAEGVVPPRPHKSMPGFLRPPEIARVRRVFPRDDRGLRDRAIFELGLMTLRISSALNLDLGDLDELDRRLVRVKLKGGDQAAQRITEAAAGAIRAWLARRPECGSAAVFVPLPPRKGPCRLEYTTVEKALRRYLRAAGITRRVRFHDLRHTAGLRLANRGVPLQIIQDIMHHKDPRTTRIYTEVDSEVIAEVVDRELQFPE
jgi:integrase/recombinase XerC